MRDAPSVRVQAMNCPACGAKLSIEPGATRVTCSYCGTTSDLSRSPPPGNQRTGPSRNPRRPEYDRLGGHRLPATDRGRAWTVTLVCLLGSVLGIGWVYFKHGPYRAVNESDLYDFTPDIAQPDGGRLPLVRDITGDGIDDVMVWETLYGGEAGSKVVIGAYDGSTGDRIWRSAVLAPRTSPDVRSALLDDVLLAADLSGQLHALEPQTARPRWTTPLGERVKTLCQPRKGEVVAQLDDDRKIGLRLADGQPAGAATDAYCEPLWTSAEHPSVQRENPRQRNRASALRNAVGLAGMNFDEVYRITGSTAAGQPSPSRPGSGSTPALWVALGDRHPTKVPMIAVYDRERVRWSAELPTGDGLRAAEGAPTVVGAGQGIVVVPSKLTEPADRWRLTAFGLLDGRRRWEVNVPSTSARSDPSAIVVHGGRVYLMRWGRLEVHAVDDGRVLLRLGPL
ncbi:MAG: hypothetical protein B7733_20410 [Myxococcales bacterium FL481]|nr:MAG: hypothetical protein B7733_20410 [Myxococcales bacterium FL481]